MTIYAITIKSTYDTEGDDDFAGLTPEGVIELIKEQVKDGTIDILDDSDINIALQE